MRERSAVGERFRSVGTAQSVKYRKYLFLLTIYYGVGRASHSKQKYSVAAGLGSPTANRAALQTLRAPEKSIIRHRVFRSIWRTHERVFLEGIGCKNLSGLRQTALEHYRSLAVRTDNKTDKAEANRHANSH